MNRLDCAQTASAISFVATILILFGASPASAHRSAHHPIPVPTPKPAMMQTVATPDVASNTAVSLPDPVLSIISANDAEAVDTSTPTIVKAIRRIYCVEFARLRSGIAIFGDAKTWWQKAKGLYAETTSPKPGAVMVFAGMKSLRHGHVAVVTSVVSKRIVRVDHANWGNDGKIYLNAPVVDVSADNDWSEVRVWNTRDGQMGSRVYPVKGFVSFRTASAD